MFCICGSESGEAVTKVGSNRRTVVGAVGLLAAGGGRIGLMLFRAKWKKTPEPELEEVPGPIFINEVSEAVSEVNSFEKNFDEGVQVCQPP
jgi:hypothetical protein